MKLFFSKLLRLAEKLRGLVLSKNTMARRILRRMEAQERKEMEAERLDRLRNPDDYQGR